MQKLQKQIFREYDIRGIYKKELNEKSVKAIGLALGRVMVKRGCKKVSVGHDARLSCKDIKNWLFSGLNGANLQIYDISLLPTPIGYFSLFYDDKFDANIMITGSHNPKNYNGFKITILKESYFGDELQELYKEADKLISSDIKDDFKSAEFDVLTPYCDYIIKSFSHLKGMDLDFVVDCGNGASGEAVSKICKALNLNAKILYANPDGNFPNHHPDPSVKENLKDIQKALDSGSKMGFGFDGDGDRIAVLTQKRDIKGDELAYLYALNMKNPRVLGEVKCSLNIYNQIDKIGKTFMGKTGHSNIKKMMKELDIDLAAEVSGHIFFKERYFGYDDAIYAMMRVLELVYKGFDLDKELDKLPKTFSTDELKIEVSEESKFKIIEILKDRLKKSTDKLPKIVKIIEIDGIRIHFENAWALVRAPNTTPVLVMRFEANTKELKDELESFFLNLIKDIKSNLKL